MQKTTMYEQPLGSLVDRELLYYKLDNTFLLQAGGSIEKGDYQAISTAKQSLIITILLEGKLEFSYEELRFNLDAQHQPSALVVNLTRPTSFRRRVQKNNRVSKLKITIPTQWIEQRAELNSKAKQFMAQNLTYFSPQLTPEIMALIAQITQQKTPFKLLEKLNLELLTQQLIQQIVAQLIHQDTRFCYQQSCTKFDLATKHSAQEPHTLEALLQFIESNLSKSLTTKDLAEQSFTSESNLHRKFKSTFGFSLQSYIKRRKLETAKQYLMSGEFTVNEVAYSVGYKHPANFTKAFKKIFGHPPTRYIEKSA